MAETPVTQAQYEAIAGKNPSKSEDRPGVPVGNVSWPDAVSWCGKLEKSCAKSSNWPGREWFADLPTEAEWEYGCRAGTETEYYTGDGKGALKQAAFYGQPRIHQGSQETRQLAPNDFGLYDMHGNVWEWCSDVFDPDAYKERSDGVSDPCVGADDVEERLKRTRDYWENVGQPDWGKGKAEGLPRVLRGGSWFNSAVGCRSAYRYRSVPGVRNWFSGFRVCLVRRPSRTKTTQTDEAERQQSRRAELRAKPERSPDGMQPRSVEAAHCARS